jgi:hypothetical protein
MDLAVHTVKNVQRMCAQLDVRWTLDVMCLCLILCCVTVEGPS